MTYGNSSQWSEWYYYDLIMFNVLNNVCVILEELIIFNEPAAAHVSEARNDMMTAVAIMCALTTTMCNKELIIC